MAEVNVEINGRKYRMACEDGQEPHLRELAERFDAGVEALKDNFGEVGDNRLTVMAGLAVLDDLIAAEDEIARLRQDVIELTKAGEALAAETEEMETRLAKRLGDAARKIESISTAIDETGAAGAVG